MAKPDYCGATEEEVIESLQEEVAEQRGLVRDLTRALENRNRELETLRAPAREGTEHIHGERYVTVPLSIAILIRKCFVPRNPNKMRGAHPDVVAAAKRFIRAVEES